MTEQVVIEPEDPSDADAVREVHVAAFDGRTEEADLVEALRDGGDMVLALVARQRGEVVGHVAFSRVMVDDPGGPEGAIGLAPVGVRPDMQHRGLGARLVEAGLEQLQSLGENVVLVVGSPAYYGRFGFTAAAAEPYPSPYSGPYFMARLLTDPATAPRGAVTYPDAFELVN